MKFIEDIFAKVRPNFEKGGKWEKFYYIYEAHETLFLVPNSTTGATGVQVRDAIDMKRMMMTVIIAMIPCLLFGIWNAGHQHYLAVGEVAALGDKLLTGAILVVPIIAVSYAVGLGIEFTFATINRHDVNEGFLVTGMLIPLVMPASIPLWQVGLATAFAVIIGKEVFGGTGMNILNVALTARAFLYFAYPSQISGDVWSYIGDGTAVAGFSGATPLAVGAAAVEGTTPMVEMLNNSWSTGLFDFWNMFLGIMPGSIGETSTLMCLIGAAILIGTGVGSWKIIFSVFAGAFVMGTVCNLVGANEYMLLPAQYHLVIGGLAFGAVFMASDPVTATQTETGKWIYGFLIGILTVIIRVFNPAYPEGIMLAILLMNVFAPLIDYYVVAANKKRRLKRATV
ncbi:MULTISPECIES: NADH:ubiquinone reductase (Na(+)-transporting) subunit B [Reichenbachiella]|uniref:Na(+)-translocating NADH-quinone reductase subunit B n=1 Tax=Reichenbachiella agariperforans TaxID=156994 RepID=A0A1M6NZ65_REIAG|nr:MULTISPECIES: NADH:ubiquinone reductase (Na(+)-transporting) subunit B [Reichenbachiella]MBU2916100.1 NADH:ubiquinone reductase (Na(+)-transporting) subunit B [Reichenbachiella agariperforans]RJE71658.1 NADH:ubiquinone reductase (Na(+)-transporting) subunit B [Reichenbachiella sp. MSK19-1]SHK00922.1 Na+-transporting NADH:ubiquinone oxidoreductase subunit B [Reichenbachiella agariperforans]